MVHLRKTNGLFGNSSPIYLELGRLGLEQISQIFKF